MCLDYFSPDGGGSGESHYKECRDCDGKGTIKEHEFANSEGCTMCNGTGSIEMTEDEIALENECRKEDAREY